MRGKGTAFPAAWIWIRITPAYAGKSHFGDLLFLFCQDHPRLCGEKYNESSFSFFDSGSPPPMRGKATSCNVECITSGITPAYAGKSRSAFRFAPACKDHPRLCGEKQTEMSLEFT